MTVPLQRFSRIGRRILEKVARWLVYRRRLPAEFGRIPLYVSPGAALAYLRALDHSNWRALFDFAKTSIRPGSVTWDVRANLGVFAFAAAQRAGASGLVVAIEPDPWLAHLMQRSASLPGDRAPVSILCAAAGSELHIEDFHVTAFSRSGSHLASTRGATADVVGPTSEVFPVITVSIDWLAEKIPPPQAIKIDVEGAELQVLRGACGVLARHRPALLLECYEADADAVTKLLTDLGYALYDFGQGSKGKRPVPRAVYHTLASPRSC